MIKLFVVLILALNFAGFELKAQSRSTSPEKVAQTEEKNKQIAENNRKIRQALTEGVKAYDEKNYRLALEKFDQAYNLNPDFWGTAPVMLNNKAMALIQLGAENYNNALKAKKDPKPDSKGFFLEAIGFLKLSQEILETAPPAEDEAEKWQIESTRYVSTKELAQAYRLLALTDETRAREAIEALENYIRIEPDASLKATAQNRLQELKSRFKIN
jgi:tetratricopeptide (TPR) repeat protein